MDRSCCTTALLTVGCVVFLSCLAVMQIQLMKRVAVGLPKTRKVKVPGYIGAMISTLTFGWNTLSEGKAGWDIKEEFSTSCNNVAGVLTHAIVRAYSGWLARHCLLFRRAVLYLLGVEPDLAAIHTSNSHDLSYHMTGPSCTSSGLLARVDPGVGDVLLHTIRLLLRRLQVSPAWGVLVYGCIHRRPAIQRNIQLASHFRFCPLLVLSASACVAEPGPVSNASARKPCLASCGALPGDLAMLCRTQSYLSTSLPL